MFIWVHNNPWHFWLSDLLGLIIIFFAIALAPWKSLIQTSVRLHLALASVLILGGFWSVLTVDVFDVFSIHPALMTATVIVFGLRIALIIGATAIVWMHLLSGAPWENIGWHYMVNIAAPAMTSRFILSLIDRMRIQNIFIFILGGGFFGSMIAAFTMGATALVLLYLSDSVLFQSLIDNAYLFLLLAFPEGFMNGAIVTTLTVLKPELVKTYDDRFYLDGKK